MLFKLAYIFCVPLVLFSFFLEAGNLLYPYKTFISSKYDNNRLELFAKFLPENPTILEAGGHFGTDTVKFAQFWPNARIFSFEPSPYAFENLRKNTQDYSNIHIYPFALSVTNKPTSLYLAYGKDNNPDHFIGGANSLIPPDGMMIEDLQGPVIKVECVVLDDWCQENAIDKIDFVWLDLEGFELPILQNSPKLMLSVSAIYTEINYKPIRNGATLYPNLRHFLLSKGFIEVGHWKWCDHQGDALFVKKEVFNCNRHKLELSEELYVEDHIR